jgi:preprotein translocase subunit SecE
MATRREKDQARKAEKSAAGPDSSPDEAEASLAVREGSDLDAASEGSSDDSDEAAEGDEQASEGSSEQESEEEQEGSDEEVAAARQLGTDRYVMSGFFAAGILAAYVIGKAIHGVWADISNRDWFSRALPAVASISDDDKTTYATIVGGIIALVVTLRTYRRPDVREWTDEVASELIKVKWPTKKDVTNSTVVVIAASAVATLYLALLDRLWSFVTSIVYGTGS